MIKNLVFDWGAVEVEADPKPIITVWVGFEAVKSRLSFKEPLAIQIDEVLEPCQLVLFEVVQLPDGNKIVKLELELLNLATASEVENTTGGEG